MMSEAWQTAAMEELVQLMMSRTEVELEVELMMETVQHFQVEISEESEAAVSMAEEVQTAD